MHRRVIRLVAATALLGAAAQPAAAAGGGCPSRIVVGGQYACHLLGGSSCELCHYNCEGSSVYFNMCVNQT